MNHVDLFLEDMRPLLSSQPAHRFGAEEIRAVVTSMSPAQMGLVRRLIRSAYAAGENKTLEGGVVKGACGADGTTDGIFDIFSGSRRRMDTQAAQTPEAMLEWIGRTFPPTGLAEPAKRSDLGGMVGGALMRLLNALRYDGRLLLMEELLRAKEGKGPVGATLLLERLHSDAIERGHPIPTDEQVERALEYVLAPLMGEQRAVAGASQQTAFETPRGWVEWVGDTLYLPSRWHRRTSDNDFLSLLIAMADKAGDVGRQKMAQVLMDLQKQARAGTIDDYTAIAEEVTGELMQAAGGRMSSHHQPMLDMLVMDVVGSAEEGR